MNRTINDFKRAFETALTEQGFTFQLDAANNYLIACKNNPDRLTTSKLICSEPINEKLHGTKNETEIKAIGYFKFEIPPEGIEPNFYIFAFSNNSDNKVEFVIVPTDKLKNRLASRKCITDKGIETELKFWLLPDGLVFDVTQFGTEGEWWFVGGRMAKNRAWDYTMFLNCWDHFL